jgi:hypothetical protein
MSFDPRISEWGNPPSIMEFRDFGLGYEILQVARTGETRFRISVITRRDKTSEYIGGFKRTQRTETSQYLEERTSTETPLVVASERGPGQ